MKTIEIVFVYSVQLTSCYKIIIYILNNYHNNTVNSKKYPIVSIYHLKKIVV